MARGHTLLAVLIGLAAASCGRVERTIQIESDPPGALVYLNGQEAGRTPMRKNFVWYGTYDVEVRKPGYRTHTANEKAWAPVWQVFPFDLLAEASPFPLYYNHRVKYTLKPLPEEGADPDELIARGNRMKERLESSKVKP